MKISVIIPIYNTSEYLKQCLDSLRAQCMQDVEFICINDGSTDASLDIMNEFAAVDSRFRVLDKENTGYGASMNVGIDAAKGEYIAILESDDYAEPDMLEKLYAMADRYAPDIVKGNFNKCDKYGTLEKWDNMDVVPYNEAVTAREYPRIFRIHPSIWTALYRKKFLKENDIKFLETPGASFQDISFSFKVLHSAESIVCIKDAVMNYRIENYSSSIFNPDKIFCVRDEIEEMRRFVKDRYDRHIIDADCYHNTGQCIDWLVYINYRWNYERLPFMFKYAALMLMNNEFVKIPKETFDSGMWDEHEINTFGKIANGMNEYYKNTVIMPKDDPRLGFFTLMNEKDKCEKRAILGFLDDYDNISIYGAGIVGKQVLEFLKKKNLKGKIQNFVVSEESADGGFLEGIPIVCIKQMTEEQLKNNLFIAAVSKKYELAILKVLDMYGVQNVIALTKNVREVMML